MPSITEATMFNYCERDHNPAFWGEPLNAITNAGFIIAALLGLMLLLRRPAAERSGWHYFFVANLIAIGIGSFMFHTMPNGTTVLMDTIPISIFMVTYLLFAVRRFVGLSWLFSALAIGGFMGASVLAGMAHTLDRSLNGSMMYAPALASLWIIAAWLAFKRRPSAGLVFGASVVFITSVTLRTFDYSLCNTIAVGDYKIGTHFLWHSLNSLTLFILLYAAIRYGGGKFGEVLPPKPKAVPPVYSVS